MRKQTLGTLVLLAVLSLVAVVATQIVWLGRAQRYQSEQVVLQKQQRSQLDKEFADRVTIALSAVTERILSITKDPSDLFDAVKQERPNYFAVTINDTIHPYLLESLLEQEFKRRGIEDDFEYGIYDCFTDSIVYGNYVSLKDSAVADTAKHTPLLKLNKDGHYFGVNFPRRTAALWEPDRSKGINWVYPAFVSLIVFIFFAYSIWIIMRQKRVEQMKNDFIGNMTHELKTPISTIALSSEVLCDPSIVQEPERLQSYAHIIRAENERLRSQVDRVLQLSRLDREHLRSEPEPVDMEQVAASVKDSYKLQIEERQGIIAWQWNATSGTVMGDRTHLTHALSNLVDNALKYSGERPHVTIRSSNIKGVLHLAVVDRGIGIHRDDLKHIFERFFRAHTGNVHDVKGFGLGLHYAQQVVMAHGGRITVQSEPGKGSTFTMELPITS
ncbi:MAG TPA: HAMP domain-containing sensor histidine kinase [Flavobacteriales bacterium]